MLMNIDFAALDCLAAVVSEGGFERAARTLGITQSAVSQRIRALEAAVGGPLLERTRPVRPLPAAQPLLRFARQTRLLAHDLLSEVAARLVGQRLRIAVNADSLATWVLPALAGWQAETGGLLEFVVDDQEHTAEWLRSGEVIGSIGTATPPGPGLRSEPLGIMRYRSVTSPAFGARHFPGGLTRAACRSAPALVFNRRDALHGVFLREALGGPPPEFPHHFVPSTDAFLLAATLGYGYGMVPEVQIPPGALGDTLIDVAPAHPVDVPLAWHTWALDSGVLHELGRALAAGARAALRPVASGADAADQGA